MSSPNHPTSSIKDAFSLKFPDYLPASPDYVPASLGNTYSNSSNSFSVVPIASPSLSLFHVDPYMKVMHAYYAKKSPTLPSINTPPSLMPNPQEFFLPEELLSPKKQGHNQSSSSTSILPQAFEIRESSRKTNLERHEEQIEEILNHLDKISLDRIEHMEDKIEGLGQGRVVIQQDLDALEAKLQQARAQITKLHRKKMGSNHKISLARFKTTDLEHIIKDIHIRGLIRWFERIKSIFSHSRCVEENLMTFAMGTLTDDALSWWNTYTQPMGADQANKITWTKLKRLLTNKYCPRTEVRKMEEELYNLILKGNGLKTYVRRFQELVVLCPNIVPNTEKLLEAFIEGLLKVSKEMLPPLNLKL
nr:reverse transcriptase domain-containing protein [Tanacetum cinerariifolium]